MAKFYYDMRNAHANMQTFARIPVWVSEKVLLEGAEVIRKAQVKYADQMLKGLYVTGTTKDSIKVGKLKHDRSGYHISIHPHGMRTMKKSHGEKPKRAGEVAFLNEYGVGKRKMAPRPFIRIANEKSERECLDTMQGVIDEYLNSRLFNL